MLVCLLFFAILMASFPQVECMKCQRPLPGAVAGVVIYLSEILRVVTVILTGTMRTTRVTRVVLMGTTSFRAISPRRPGVLDRSGRIPSPYSSHNCD